MKHITSAAELERVLYRQNLWPEVHGKFSRGATLRVVRNAEDAVAAGVTNRVNGVRQWRIRRDVAPSDLEVLRRLDPNAP